MSESLEFIAIIAVLAVILFWYLQNIRADAMGTQGLLALRDDPKAPKTSPEKKSYKVKSRTSPGGNQPRMTNDALQNPPLIKNNTAKAPQMRRKFRRQDEVRYRVKDKKRDS